MSQEWVTRPERGNVFAIHFIVWLALTGGRRIARLLLYPICFYFVLFSGAARAASRIYLNRVLLQRTKFRNIFKHYFFFASTILDRVFLLHGDRQIFDVRVENPELIEDLLSHQGCILIGGHLGSFEMLHAIGHSQGDFRINMVMYEDNAKKLNDVLQSINPLHNPPVIPLGKIDSMLRIHEALERGESIGMLADRTLSGEQIVACGFLGEPIDLPLGPFRLAAILDRPVILMFGLYQGGNRYNIYLERLTVLQDATLADRPAAVKLAVQQFAARLEHYCRLSPYNWFNFYDIWK